MKTSNLARVVGVAVIAMGAYSCAPVLVSKGANEGVVLVGLIPELSWPEGIPRPESGIKKVEETYEGLVYRQGVGIQARYKSGIMFKIDNSPEVYELSDIASIFTGKGEKRPDEWRMKDVLVLTYPTGEQICYVDLWVRSKMRHQDAVAYGRYDVDEKYERLPEKSFQRVGGSRSRESEFYKSLVLELKQK